MNLDKYIFYIRRYKILYQFSPRYSQNALTALFAREGRQDAEGYAGIKVAGYRSSKFSMNTNYGSMPREINFC